MYTSKYPFNMLEIIIKLLIAMGLYTGAGPVKTIIVIDSSTGVSYTPGVTIGTTASITNPSTPPDVYYLVHNTNGTYSLVHH